LTFTQLAWAFVLAVVLHNLEEAVWLPAWSQDAGLAGWLQPIGAPEFRFAVVVLTLAAVLAAALAQTGGKRSIGAYLISGYALAMLLNVVFPHVMASLLLWDYAPGTLTAVLLNLPICALLLRQALRERYVEPLVFVWAGPLVVLAIVGAIPILFGIRGILPGHAPG
jgi:hypothetical protein